MGNVNDDPLEDGNQEGGEDRFWRDLCGELRRADAASADELAEAERLLASLDDAEALPLEAEAVAQLQRAAIDGTLGGAAAEQGPADAAPVTAPAVKADSPVSRSAPSIPPIHVGRFRRFFAAAAAVLVAPKFLAAAALVTVAAATTNYYLRFTTKSLPFLEAIEILVDQSAVDASRGSAQGRVAFDVAESLQAVRVLDGEDPSLRQHADKVREDLRARFGAPPVFVMRRFESTLDEVVDVMLDRAAALDDRHEALDALANQMGYGVAALLWVRPSLSPELLEQNRAWMARLEEMLR